MASEKFNRLKELMGQDAFKDLETIFTKEVAKPSQNLNELRQKYIFPKIRHYGSKVLFKQRKLKVLIFNKNDQQYIVPFNHKIKSILLREIEQKIKLKYPNFNINNRIMEVLDYLKNKGSIADIDHYSVWINNQIYHFGPGKSWRIYGSEETDREIVNDEWTTYDQYPNIYFTLKNKEEIEQFVKEYPKKYDNQDNNSLTFIEKLYQFLDLDYDKTSSGSIPNN